LARSQLNDKPAAGPQDHYAVLHGGFGWQVPEHFNMARGLRCALGPGRRCVRAGRGDRRRPDARARTYSYAELQQWANRLSRVLHLRGVRAGDRVAIVLPQRFETAVAYMAVLQMGAVAMPLSMLFGPEALAYRLQDSGAVVAICDGQAVDRLHGLREDCPAVRAILRVGGRPSQAEEDFHALLGQEPAEFAAVPTGATIRRC
jgi:acetyl-CoA synthetase